MLTAAVAFASSAAARADDQQRNHFWLGVTYESSVGFHRAQSDVCKLNASLQPTSGYDCTADAVNDYPSRTDPRENAQLVAGEGDSVSGGISAAAYRAGLLFEVAATDHLLIGVRGGWNNSRSFGTSFPSYLFAESRATFLFGRHPLRTRRRARDDPLERFPLRMSYYTLVGVGLGTFGETLPVPIVTRGGSGPAELNANRTAGPLYTTVGAGIRVGGDWSGFMLAPLKMTFAFGRHTMALISPEFAMEFGF